MTGFALNFVLHWNVFVKKEQKKEQRKEAHKEMAEAKENAAQVIDPWNVQGEVVDGQIQAINYNSLIEQFGTRPISQDLLDRFEKLTGRKPHIFLRRGIFFSHRYTFVLKLMEPESLTEF